MKPRPRDLVHVVIGLGILGAFGAYLIRSVSVENFPGETEYRLGNRFLQKGRAEDALNAFDRAIAENPGYAPSHMSRGLTLMALGRTNDSLNSLNRAIEQDDQLAEAYANRGVLHDRSGRHPAALQDYHAALELKPALANGPGAIWRFLHSPHVKPTTIRVRAEYLEAELEKATPLLRAPEQDQRQKMRTS